MRNWILLLTIAMVSAGSALRAGQQDARQLAARGYGVFIQVLGGDEAKFSEAVSYMEEARNLDGANVNNLYNLGRAHYYDAITFNRRAALEKAEEVFARILELNPDKTEALAFHGSVLVLLNRGNPGKAMQGFQEVMTAVQRDPQNINNLLVLSATVSSLPKEAMGAGGRGGASMTPDPSAGFNFVANALDGFNSSIAPHVGVVMKAIQAEMSNLSGDIEKARLGFEAALAVPRPKDARALAGREVLDRVISRRLDGGTKPIFEDPVFVGCHSCHLNAPEKLLPR